MFSFFRSSKKPSPAESAENSDAASAASLPASISDDYVMIEQRNRQPQPDPHQQAASGGGVYPSLGPDGPTAGNRSLQRGQSETFSYLQGVPFKLSPDIRTNDADPTEVTRYEVDQILANMTRAMDMYATD